LLSIFNFNSVFAPALLFAVVSLLSICFSLLHSLSGVVVGCLLLCSCLFGVFLFVVGLLVRGCGWGFVLCALLIVIWWGKFIYILFGCKSVSYILIEKIYLLLFGMLSFIPIFAEH
jgi:hypothetical protein